MITDSDNCQISGLIVKYPRSVAVNHAGLWIRRHQFESGRGYRSPSIISLLYHHAEEQ